MAQDIVIGGRLHSAATGNTVAGANEILDDAKGKKQNVINQEVDNEIGSDSAAGTIKGRIKNLETAVGSGGSVDERIAETKAEIIGDAAADYNTLGKVEDKIQETKSEILGDAASDYNTLGKVEDKIQAETSRAEAAEGALDNAKANKATTLEGYGIIDAYTKNETYTKTEVNGLVDTPHQNYVTVLTYAALIAIDPGSTDTIYRVSNYDGSVPQVDVTKYSEYAWDGTQYVFLCVKSQIDEVFDISVYNNNATYADLAAALGTDGANVPQTLRRGGMSIKFVLTSDNKYVQYRLMSDTFNTTPTNWQGVDDEPTAGSDNLVKSGGVASYVNDFTGSCIIYHDTQDDTLAINGNVGDVLRLKITNKSDSDGYFNLNIDDGKIYNLSILAAAGATVTETITLNCEPHTVAISNPNNKDFICVIENLSQTNRDLSKSVRRALNLLRNYALEPQTNSYSEDFDVVLEAQKQYYLKIQNKSDGEGYYAANIFDENGNVLYSNNWLCEANSAIIAPVFLNIKGTSVSINNINQRNSEFSIYFENEVADVVMNNNKKFTVGDFDTFFSENCTLTKNADSIVASKNASGYFKVDMRNSTPTSIGDFIFLMMKIKSTVSEWVRVTTWSDGVDQKMDYFYLEAGTERTIAFRGANISVAGSLNVIVEQPADLNFGASVITIKDFEVYKNGYTNINLPNLDYSGNNKIFIVDKNGGGHFYSVANAVNYIRNSFDVDNEDYMVFVKNGLYDKEKNDVIEDAYPYAVINKGSNRISIIGESKENTIIRWANTSNVEYKVVEVGSSPCVIANLKIECLNGTGYDPQTSQGHNPYCLHIDLGGDIDTWGKYQTEVYNCHLYDECHSPIGAGLTKNQTINVHDCYLEANSKTREVFDTLYIHAHADGKSTVDDTMAVDIENNVLINKSGGKALTLPDVGQSTFDTILCTIIGNLLYSSNASNIVDSDAGTRYNKVPYCMGNNIPDLNSFEYTV